MNTALYDIYSGLTARLDALDVIANNLANANTSGFKQEGVFYHMLEANLSQNQKLPAAPRRMTQANTYTDFKNGDIITTGRPLDFALQGDGFFVVQGRGGETYYTRDGSFQADEKGNLITSQGDSVVGDTGPISLPRGTVSVGDEGAIMVDDVRSSTLKIVEFSDPKALTKVGDNYFQAAAGVTPAAATGTTVSQGFLEKSNVGAIQSMVDMMQAMRQAESLQRSLYLILNDVDGKVIREVARV